jgi:hypothetical protein
MRIGVPLALWLVVTVAAPLRAQEPAAEPRLSCDGVSAGGNIRGVLLNDSSGLPIPRTAVYLVSTDCFTVTDPLGRFQLERVPPGQHRVTAGTLFHRAFQPVLVDVDADAVVEVVLRLRPQNRVADCLEIESCASLLRADAAMVAHLSAAERLEEAAWRTSIALAGMSSNPEWVPCATVASERIRRVLARRIPTLALISDCRPDSEDPFRWRLVHLPGGSRAFHVRLASVEVVADGAVSGSAYIVGPQWAASWTCRYSREGGEWSAVWCGVDRVA